MKVTMKIMYCVNCSVYRKVKNTKMPYIFDKTLVTFIICGKCDSNNEKVFREKKSIEISSLRHICKFFNPIQDVHFESAHGLGAKKASVPKICHTYLTNMKLRTVMPYLKEIGKIY